MLPWISIHASRGGSDAICRSCALRSIYFNPRFPRGKRRPIFSIYFTEPVFQSTLPAGEATWELLPFALAFPISIHASRGGSDTVQGSGSQRVSNFNPRFPRGKRPLPANNTSYLYVISIHASRGGSDVRSGLPAAGTGYFNPRFPRGKRPTARLLPKFSPDFNPRFPRGKRPASVSGAAITVTISIHASRGGSDRTAI